MRPTHNPIGPEAQSSHEGCALLLAVSSRYPYQTRRDIPTIVVVHLPAAHDGHQYGNFFVRLNESLAQNEKLGSLMEKPLQFHASERPTLASIGRNQSHPSG